MDLKSNEVVANVSAPSRSRWDLAVACVVYSLTHDGTDEFPGEFFRNAQEVEIVQSLTTAERFAAAGAVCEAAKKVLPTTGSRAEVVEFAGRMTDHFAVRARAHARSSRNHGRPRRTLSTRTRAFARPRRREQGGRRRARAPTRRSSGATSDPDDEPSRRLARESGSVSVPGPSEGRYR